MKFPSHKPYNITQKIGIKFCIWERIYGNHLIRKRKIVGKQNTVKNKQSTANLLGGREKFLLNKLVKRHVPSVAQGE